MNERQFELLMEVLRSIENYLSTIDVRLSNIEGNILRREDWYKP